MSELIHVYALYLIWTTQRKVFTLRGEGMGFPRVSRPTALRLLSEKKRARTDLVPAFSFCCDVGPTGCCDLARSVPPPRERRAAQELGVGCCKWDTKC